MAGLIITPKGKAYKVPECECGSRMIPKDYEPESGMWKCPHCMKEKEVKND
jgi:hypothetical protein